VYWTETQIDAIFNSRVGNRKVRTAEELEDVLRASGSKPLPAHKVWILEGLEGVAQRLAHGQ